MPTSPDCDSAAASGPRKVLYYGASPSQFTSLLEAMAASADTSLTWPDGEASLRCVDTPTLWLPTYEPEATMVQLQDRYASLLLLDLRRSHGAPMRPVQEGHRLLALLDDPVDIEARYGFHRILALVSGPEAEAIDALMVTLGGQGVQHVLRERDEEPDFAGRVSRQINDLLGNRQPGKTALCAAGGGITGIYFELGAIKCLDDCLVGGALRNFDLYFGISAGAVVTSALRVGYSVDEFMAAIAGVEGGRMAPLDLSLVKLGHLNLPDLKRRLRIGTAAAARATRDALLRRSRIDADSIFLGATALVGAPFHSDRFGQILQRLYSQPGASNDFRDLPLPLYVGASDQDSKRHVIFGSEERMHIPIHLAVQASLSINPAFSAVPIEGRYYEDGAVTQTSNFTEAIRRGADLVISLDPFVPYHSREAGSVNARGMLYNIDQDVRSLSFSRFVRTRDWALRTNPSVSSYTFLPSNSTRRLLSQNPMDHRPYLPIWKGAYLSTLARIRTLCHRLRGDLHAHDIKLDTDRADAVAARLEATETPTFSDFYPDGRPVIPRPQLALEGLEAS